MAGNLCFVCGLDFRVVKLVAVNTFDEKGRAIQITTCEAHKELMIKNNHPLNEATTQSGDQNVTGFVKPSQSDVPPVRPT